MAALPLCRDRLQVLEGQIEGKKEPIEGSFLLKEEVSKLLLSKVWQQKIINFP